MLDSVLSPRQDPESTRERILTGALDQFAETGLRRTTVEDIARRAGLARVTVYRHFANRDEISQAVLLGEIESFFSELDRAVEPYTTAEERLVEGFVFALEFLHEHALLRRLLRTEPETILPYLALNSPTIAFAREAVAERVHDPALEVTLPDRTVAAIAELVVRLVHSMVLNPATALGEGDPPSAAREAAERWLLPSLRRAPDG